MLGALVAARLGWLVTFISLCSLPAVSRTSGVSRRGGVQWTMRLRGCGGGGGGYRGGGGDTWQSHPRAACPRRWFALQFVKHSSHHATMWSLSSRPFDAQQGNAQHSTAWHGTAAQPPQPQFASITSPHGEADPPRASSSILGRSRSSPTLRSRFRSRFRFGLRPHADARCPFGFR